MAPARRIVPPLLDPRIGWEVMGYATLDDFRADQARGFQVDLDTALSCYLVAE